MADPVSIGMLVGGVGMQVAGQIGSANAKAQAATRDAAIKTQQANEVEQRANRNERTIQQRGQELVGEQEGAFASGGVEMSGSALSVLEQTNSRIANDVFENYHESRFRSAQLREGAAVSTQLASNTRTAGMLGAAGSILGGASKAYGLMSSSSNPIDKVSFGDYADSVLSGE